MKILLSCLAALLLAPAASQAQTMINSLPYTISAPGKYQLATNLIYSSNGLTNLITVNSANVVLDLNEYFVSGPGTLPGSLNAAIYVANVSNFTVRNGTLANTGYGIYYASGANSINHVVENVNVTRCYLAGIYFQGSTSGSLIRNSSISDTGNSSLSNQDANGIYTFSGVRVENCSINRVTPSGTGTSYGINGASGSFYIGNTISNCTIGIINGKYLNNLTSGCTTPFSGGTNAVGNN